MKLEKTVLSLSQSSRSHVAKILNQQLANLFDLYSQVKQAHWNVRGKGFYESHLLFDRIAESIEGELDALAERITTLGVPALGTVRLAATSSEVKELATGFNSPAVFIKELAERAGQAANRCRQAISDIDEIDDDASEDLLTGILRTLDQSTWLLEASK